MIRRTSCVLLSNIRTLYNSVTPQSTSIITVSVQSWHESYVNNFTICLKNFVNSKQFSSATSPTEQNIIITEEDRTKLLKWIDMCRFEGIRAPKNISEEQFLELFGTKNEEMRIRYLNYLYKKEAAHENDQRRKEKKSLDVLERKEKRLLNLCTDHISYGLWRNALFSKSSKRHVIDLYHHRLITAMKIGQPLVIDLGFDDHMEGREITSYAEQLVMAISMNRSNREPFNLTLCNTNFDSKPFKKFTRFIPSVLQPSYPINMHKESYLDIFPKEKLIYLTPNARDEMKQFDHGAIYIIGGIVDIGIQKPLTFAKAKKENIKMQKLPVDKYLICKQSKTFTIPVMLAILAAVAEHGDWGKAFKYIPKRNIGDRGTGTYNVNTDPWNKRRRIF